MINSSLNLAAISRLFSSSVFRQLAEKGRSPIFARLISESGLVDDSVAAESVGACFDTAFSALRKLGNRDEYVYKAALTHNILLGKHSLRTASLLTEFRAGACKADLAILNGTSTVYEIKSERDTLARLSNQLENYRKVFAKVYVVVAEGFVDQVIKTISDDVGVMSLARWDRTKTIREAVDRSDQVCPVTIFESLRSAEAVEILKNLGVPIPQVSNIQLHSELRKCFEGLEPKATHSEMVNVLKRTRSLASLESFVGALPQSLRPAALSIQLRRVDHQRLLDSLRTPTFIAMKWAT